jgi:uncharacterized membrane protein
MLRDATSGRLRSQLLVLAAMAFATLFCCGLFALRVFRAHAFTYRYLIWNLFLAWLPALGAFAAHNLHRRQSWFNWFLICGFAIFWLAFFPNAPYLITDLMHLRQNTVVPFWFDLLLFVAFAWTGFFLGLVSLLLMQEIVRKVAGAKASWAFAFIVLGLSSFGIYLGRFLRWNSWDLFLNPGRLLVNVSEQAQDPLTRFQAILFSLLFAGFFLSMYMALVALTRLHWDVRQET